MFFHWGNLFGIVKHIILPEDKIAKRNMLLIEFEPMRERNLDQCVEQYQQKLTEEINTQKELLTPQNSLELSTPPTAFKTPALTLGHYFLIDKL